MKNPDAAVLPAPPGLVQRGSHSIGLDGTDAEALINTCPSPLTGRIVSKRKGAKGPGSKRRLLLCFIDLGIEIDLIHWFSMEMGLIWIDLGRFGAAELSWAEFQRSPAPAAAKASSTPLKLLVVAGVDRHISSPFCQSSLNDSRLTICIGRIAQSCGSVF